MTSMGALAASGVVFGLSGGLTPGPLMAVLVSETMAHGPRAGVKVAAAPLITDLPIALAAVFALARLAHVQTVVSILYLSGGLFLGWLAYESLRFSGWRQDFTFARERSLQKGIMVNFLNPSPYLFWMTVGAPSVLEAGRIGLGAQALFVLLFYFCLVGSKASLALLAGRFRQALESRVYAMIIRILGLLLLAFAVLFAARGAAGLFGASGLS